MLTIKEFEDLPLEGVEEFSLDDILADVKDYDMQESGPDSDHHKPNMEIKPKKKKKPYRGMRIAAILLSIILFAESLYCVFAFSDLPVCVYLREMYIDTALETGSHQWLAHYFLPKYIVQEREQNKLNVGLSQVGHNSSRPAPKQPSAPSAISPENPNQPQQSEVPPTSEDAFFELFWELSRSSFEAYLDKHPEVLANGWENIYINEAGLNDEGTSIYTTMNEQVLAIDVPNKILILRVEGSGYLGVLAVCKDPSQLRCEASAGIGSYGQKVGTIVENSGAVLGMCASGFYDPEGRGNGGILAGYAMCEGKEYGQHYKEYGYKRIELAQDNNLYIIDSNQPLAPDVTDACEFTPALIIDGEFALTGWAQWNANNPRACLGQGVNGEILMMIIEGRQIGRSIGTTVEECANIFMRHKAYTAMNLDGGASAIMYYDGEYIVQCSNSTAEGRFLPNAWVYGNYE